MDTMALIGLGSNLGDRKAHLDAAITALRDTAGVHALAVSTYHETLPIGGPSGQRPFLNAAARLMTALDAPGLLAVLQDIERQAGRVRVERWGERTLDLDLLMFDARNLQSTELMLPHPRMAVRRFVLAPLSEVAPDVVGPVTGMSIREMLANLDRRPSYVALDGPPGPVRSFVFETLVSRLDAISVQGADQIEAHLPDVDIDRVVPWPLELRDIHQPHEMALGDRWLVSDFCLDLIESRLDRPRSEVQRLPAPTFAIVLDGETGRPPRPYHARFPLLRLDATDPEKVASEALAACQASRGR